MENIYFLTEYMNKIIKTLQTSEIQQELREHQIKHIRLT